MPPVTVYQTAFNRGELDPALSGRNDWQSYFSGARIVRNMICRTQGGAVKRAGLEFVAESLDQTKPSVFIRFRFSVQQVYLLEFSDYRFRVFMDGGVVLYPTGHAKAGQQVIIDSPYSAEQMRRVRVAQTEDVMIFTHPAHQPRSLTRKDHHIWEFDALSFGTEINPPQRLRLTKDGLNSVQYVVAAIAANNEESLPGDVVTCGTSSGVTYPTPDYNSLTIENCYQLWVYTYLQTWPAEWDIWNNETGWIVYEFIFRTLGSGFPVSVIENTTYSYEVKMPDGVKYKYKTSAAQEWYDLAILYTNRGYGDVLATMRQRIKDFVEEANATSVATGHSTLEWDAATDAQRYRVYRSLRTDEGLRFHPIGETNRTTFDDDNLAFLNSTTPQASKEPFAGPGNYPGVCSFYQQRLILARTDAKPNTVWGSRVGAYKNFNSNTVGEDGEDQGSISDTSAFEFTLQADDVNEILWGKSMSDLLFGTAGGEFRMGGNGYIITPTNVSAARQSNYGCSPIDPIVVGQAVLGVGRGNRVLRAYHWDYSGDAYRGTNVSHYAGHLFNGRQIVSIAYQQEPESVLWVVMSDGALLSLTYMSEEEVLGWARHDTDGKFEAAVTMSDLEGNEEIYFLVARTIGGVTKRYIERMKTIQVEGEDIAGAWYVDSGLTRVGAPTKTFSGLGHLEGKTVVCLGDGHVYENLVVSGGGVTLPRAVSRATIGLPYTAELETMELEPPGGTSIAHTSKSSVIASVLFYHSRECIYGRSASPKPFEFRFRTEDPDRPIQPKTIRKNISLPSPVGDNRATLWLACPSPVPFGVLSATLEYNVGAANPHPGRAFNVA